MRIEPKKILCAVDFSDYSGMVISYGSALAKQFDAKLTLCHVVSTGYLVSSHMTPYIDYVGLEAERIEDSQDRLEKMAEDLDMECDVIVLTGNPAEVISQVADDRRMDMVVAATHGGSGIKRFLIGSVTDRLLKILSCPFLVLHASENEKMSLPMDPDKMKFKRILVGCDFSPDSKRAFDYALSLAQEYQAELNLAHVIRPLEKEPFWDLEETSPAQGGLTAWNTDGYLNPQIMLAGKSPVEKSKLIKEIEKKLIGQVPEDSQIWCVPKTVILEGQPYRELIHFSEENQMDLIVLGVHGHSFFERFVIGPTTDRVIARAGRPVLVIRTQMAETDQKSPPAKKEAKSGAVLCAADIMEQDVISVTPETDITIAAKILLDNHINGVPVLDEDEKLLGILCQSDLIFQQKEIPVPPIFSMLDSVIPLSLSSHIEEELEKMSAVSVAQAMVKDPVTVNLDTPVSKIADLMVKKHFHTIPVTEGGRLMGIIGKEDVLRVLVS